MMDKIISAKNVELKFGKGSEEVVALKNISLEVGAGEFVSFIGPSGCGKTTFLRTIAALENPTSGQILVNGVCVQIKIISPKWINFWRMQIPLIRI